jgi:Protein of unknown function (DUF2510)
VSGYGAAMSGSQPPGWYPAPGSPNTLQWWDGLRWTGEVRDADDKGDAEEAAGPAKATGAASGQAAAGEPAAWRAPAVEAWQARTAPEPPRRFRRWPGRTKRT